MFLNSPHLNLTEYTFHLFSSDGNFFFHSKGSCGQPPWHPFKYSRSVVQIKNNMLLKKNMLLVGRRVTLVIDFTFLVQKFAR